MRATIVGITQRNGAGGSAKVYDYFILKCATEVPNLRQILEPCADFPRGAKIGDQVQLDYIQIGGGWRWYPTRIIGRAA